MASTSVVGTGGQTAGAEEDSKNDDGLPRNQAAGTQVVSDGSIRVDVGLLDRLMNLVGELVLTRNQILQTATDATLAASAQHLNLITTELQEGVMKTRMQPISNITGRFPRVVRDLAVACGKSVRLDVEGADTELDKTLIEAIKDPLTHIVRNSVDHGIESPDVRAARGKPTEGRIVLRAFHEGKWRCARSSEANPSSHSRAEHRKLAHSLP